MAYHNVEQDFAQMHIQDRSKKLPPALAPKPKPYTAAPTPYRPGGATGYRPVYPDQDFLPPPPSQPGSFPVTDDNFPPPPPPPEAGRGGYGYPEDDFPPPPPTTAPPRGYDPHPQAPGGGGVYRAQPHHISPPYPEEYRRSPRDFGRTEGRMSPYSAAQGGSSSATYMNVGPAPPPQRDEDEFIHPSQVYRAKPVISQHMEKPVPGPQVPSGPPSPPGPTSPKAQQGQGQGQGHNKEAEVDALTSLLVQSMESSSDPDFFGMCSKCGQKVIGEINGCTAMEQIYHIGCFTCVNCGNRLQGKSFFAVETKPYCEPCYMNTLEKCSVCSSPITDRLLRATGKPYHPACFTCVVCGKSLDGVPFTVDATNQIHCIEDFHKKFAPRCCVCQQPIMPESGQEETIRIVAMDRSFHVQCYRCEDCGMQLSSEEEGRGCYPLDDHILCKNCNAKRIQKMTTKIATEL